MFSASLPHLRYIWLVTASMIAGVMNAMAGGGSFVSFPAMLAMGIMPVQANATNTVAIWPGQLTSLATLRGDIRKDLLPALGVSCVLGGIAGAEVLVHTSQGTFLQLIPWLILIGTLIFGASAPVSKWIRRRSKETTAEPKIGWLPLLILTFPVTFYIGYFGAGGGFVIMTILALFGMEDMHQLNALKVFAALLANFCAIVTFIFQRQVVWHDCLIAMIFASLGGWIGARFARKVNGDVLRAIVVGTGCMIAAYFFWKQGHA